MLVIVEAFGIVRDLIGGPTEQLHLVEPATARQALRLLAERHPSLVGPVLEARGTPNSHYLLNLDGRRFLKELDEPLPEGSHLLLMAAASGGMYD